MISRLLAAAYRAAALGYDHVTYYCANCGGHFPAGHFPCV